MTPEQKERLRILKEMDVDAALKAMAEQHGFMTDTREQSIAGMHKARVILGVPLMTKEEVKISKKWLRDNGYAVPNKSDRLISL